MTDTFLIRFIDRWVGSVLCGVLSVYHKVFRCLFKPKKNALPETFLFIELFEMGAAIMAAPSVTYVQKMYPIAKIYGLTTSSCSEAWKILGQIPEAHLFVLDSKSPLRLVVSFCRILFRIRKINFSVIIDFGLFMRISAIVAGVLRTKSRACFRQVGTEGLYRGSFFNRVCPFNQNMHIAKNFLALTKGSRKNNFTFANDQF